MTSGKAGDMYETAKEKVSDAAGKIKETVSTVALVSATALCLRPFSGQ
jgi:hypothetical protein